MSVTSSAPAAAGCGLCSRSLGPVVAESDSWRLILNRNQNLLGKCFLVSRRHIEAVCDLGAAEWADLRDEVVRATASLQSAFQPDHFNYAFLQNQDRHVHLHLIPRYAAQRCWNGLIFTDPDYPGHYAVPGPDRRLSAGDAELLAQTIRGIGQRAVP